MRYFIDDVDVTTGSVGHLGLEERTTLATAKCYFQARLGEELARYGLTISATIVRAHGLGETPEVKTLDLVAYEKGFALELEGYIRDHFPNVRFSCKGE